MELGLVQGLSQDFMGEQRINDARQQYLILNDANQRAEIKAANLAKDAEFQNAMNDYDRPIIEQKANQIIQELGKFRMQNPGWQIDVGKRMVYNQMKNQLLNMPELKKGLDTDANYKAMVTDYKAAQQNAAGFNKAAFDKYLQEWNNYRTFGNQRGEEAAKTEGTGNPFIYQKPKEFINLGETGIKLGNSIKNYQVKPLNGNPGSFYTEADKNELETLAKSFYAENKDQFDTEAQRTGQDPIEIAKQSISAGVQKHHSMGDIDYNLKLAQFGLEKERLNLAKGKAGGGGSNGPAYTTWHDFMKHPAGNISSKTVSNVWGPRPKIAVISNRGDKKVDLTGEEFNAYGHMNVHGVKNVVGYVEVPLEKAIQLGIAEDPLIGSAKISGDYDKNAKLTTASGKDGKPQQVVRITTALPIDPTDQVAQKLFEIETMVDKQVPAPFNNTPNQQMWESGGKRYIKNPDGEGYLEID